nr:wall-associated receptor kinase-like 9 [Quercus suber]
MAGHLVIRITFIVLFTCELAEAAPTIAKHNCRSSCGHLQIPYPFGIGPDCYLDKWFEIVCNTTGGSAKALLTSMNMELAGNHRVTNISGSPFNFSASDNTFISVGCDNFATIAGIFPKVFGCKSDCKRDSKVDKEVICSGFNCCESTNIPSNLQAFDVEFRSVNESNDREGVVKGCKYAFLVDQVWLKENKPDPSSVQYWEYVPVVLEWAIFQRNNNSREFFYLLKNRRKVNCSYPDVYTFYCDCAPGYRGNPYVEGGCEGFNCCESTNIPSNLQAFDVEFRSVNESNDREGVVKGCKYAFLVDQVWLKENKPDPSSVQYWEYVPVVLEWAIFQRNNNSREFFNFLKNRRKVSCSYPDVYTFYCDCAPGYRGNPYVEGGCEDINECEDNDLNYCGNKLECENTDGGYICNKRKSKSKMVIIGLGTSLGVLCLPTTWVIYKRIKKRNKIKIKKKFFKKNGGLLLQQQLSSTENNVQNIRLFNSKELEKATDHFCERRIVGKGGQGTVYKGMLSDGQIIAIKKGNILDEGNLKNFINEIIILSQINHRNVVKLLGCCLETKVPLLVYEFIPNGTLFQYLHEENEEFPLTWDMRLRIAIEIAGALSYLHSEASSPIYHRDIKSTNILLDEKYRAKVADFGTSKSVKIDQTHVTTLVHGTFGYLDPEYFQTSQFTEKSDVYSFGVVLAELLTGEKPVSSTRSEEGRSLSTYFILSMKQNHLFEILDDRIKKEGDKEEIIIVANLAKSCLHLNGKKRPTMGEVAMELQGIQKASRGEQNYEELQYVRSKEIDPSYVCSTSS